MAYDPKSVGKPHSGFNSMAVSGGKQNPHPGFASVQSKIASQKGIPMNQAGAILAASSRGASKSAKAANPNLRKVK